MSILSEQFVFDAIDAEKTGEGFPVDFDNVWEVLGYSTKGNALRPLTQYCVEDVDYRVFIISEENSEGRPRKAYRLTLDAFKSFCMVANTDEGRESRLHFIEVEKRYREQLERQFRAESSPVATYTDVSALYAQMADLHRENAHLREQLQALQQARAEVIETSNTRKVFLPNKEEFNIPFQAVMDVIGYASGSYLRTVLKDDFTEGLDWQQDGLGDVMLTEAAFHELAIVARARRGAKSDRLPEILVVERDRMFRSAEARANTRFAKSLI